MQATPDQTDFKPPRPGRWSMPMVLAMAAHLALIAALTWGVHWQKNAEPVAFEAELWSSVVQEAAPRAVEPPPPPPKVAPKVEPKPPKAEPKPEPKTEPKPPDTREADIAIEQAKKKKEEEAKKREGEKKEAARKKAEQDKADKLDREKKAKEVAKEKAKKQAEQEAKRKALDDKFKQLADEKKEADLEKERQSNIARMIGQAGATGDANARGTAQRSSGPSASYKQKLSAAFKRNIVFSNPESISGNPKAEVQVTIGPTGRVMSARLTRSSGVPAWDSAVLRAAEKTTIPADENGRIPPGFPVEFGPKD